MVIKTDYGEIEIREITYKQRRKLHAMNTKTFVSEKPDVEAYYATIEYALEVAFVNPAKELKDRSDVEIDTIGQEIIAAYLIRKKK